MRILIWSGSYPPSVGGVEVVVAELARSLADRGALIQVVTQSTGEDDTTEIQPEGLVHRLPFHQALSARDPTRVLALSARVAALVSAFAPDVVHAHAVHPSELFLLSVVARLRCPLVFTLHGWTSMAGGTEAVRSRMLRAATVITGCSHHVVDRIVEALPDAATRSLTIYNGCRDVSVPIAARPIAPPHLLCVGRLIPMKGFDDMIAAMARVRARYPTARLTIAGDGPERSAIAAACHRLNLTGCIAFVGEVARDEVFAQLNTATLLVVPSRAEGLGMVAIEAAMMERPVIAMAVGGLCEAVLDGRTGLLVRDRADLASAILRLLDEPDFATELGRAGRVAALDRFDWERQVDHYVGVYDRAVESSEQP